jgi:hypothetical protein
MWLAPKLALHTSATEYVPSLVLSHRFSSPWMGAGQPPSGHPLVGSSPCTAHIVATCTVPNLSPSSPACQRAGSEMAAPGTQGPSSQATSRHIPLHGMHSWSSGAIKSIVTLTRTTNPSIL